MFQSFAHDNTRQQIHFAQTKSQNADPDHVGDLWITRTDQVGNQFGAMALHGFGHGVSIAVEPYDGEVYLWTEWKSSTSGFGTRLARIVGFKLRLADDGGRVAAGPGAAGHGDLGRRRAAAGLRHVREHRGVRQASVFYKGRFE